MHDLLQPQCRPYVEAVEKHFPALKSALAGVGGEPIGLARPALQPPFSPIEDHYVEDYLGLIGVPLKPVQELRWSCHPEATRQRKIDRKEN